MDAPGGQDPTFREVQRFRQWWIVVLVVFPVVVAWLAFLQQIVRGAPFGTNPAPDALIWAIFVLFGIAMPVGFVLLRLVTEVRGRRLSVGFPPFRARRLDLDEILDVTTTTQLRPIAHWGGYGYRRRLGGDTAFLVRGRRAVEVALGGGKRLVIGSQRPEALAAALASGRHEPPTG